MVKLICVVLIYWMVIGALSIVKMLFHSKICNLGVDKIMYQYKDQFREFMQSADILNLCDQNCILNSDLGDLFSLLQQEIPLPQLNWEHAHHSNRNGHSQRSPGRSGPQDVIPLD